jgi:cardiolipin synthase C
VLTGHSLRLPLLPLIAAIFCVHGCAGQVTRPPSLPVSQALPDPLETIWGRHFARAEKPPSTLSGFHVLQEGMDGLAARVQIIRGAERTLDLQYFIFRGDATGSLIRQELRDAADRGVRVRVLVDDGDTQAGDEVLLALDGYRDMHVRVFNPFSYRGHNRILRNLDYISHKSRLDYRMHNKLLVADNSVALVGGRNIGNQYFQVDPASQFADDDVFVVGPAVRAMSGAFDEFWNSDMAVPAIQLDRHGSSRHHSVAPTPLAGDYLARIESGQPLAQLLGDSDSLTWGASQVLYDSPQKRRIERSESRGRLMSNSVEAEIGRTKHELEIVSPYFVPSDHELDLLKDARARNVSVRILTNSLETNPEAAAQSGYAKIRKPLLQSGVQIYEVRSRLDSVRGSGQGRNIAQYGNYALHAKMYVFDSRSVFLGSWNYDQRSLRINTEMGILINSPVIAQGVVRRFDQMTSPKEAYEVVLETSDQKASHLVWKTEIDNQPQILESEPARGWWQRLKAKMLGLLPLQSEL